MIRVLPISMVANDYGFIYRITLEWPFQILFWKGYQAIFTRSEKFWKFALITESDSFIKFANWLHWTIPLFLDCRDRLFFFRLDRWLSLVPSIVDTNDRFVKRLRKFQMPILILLHQFFRKRDLIRLSTSVLSIFPLTFQ